MLVKEATYERSFIAPAGRLRRGARALAGLRVLSKGAKAHCGGRPKCQTQPLSLDRRGASRDYRLGVGDLARRANPGRSSRIDRSAFLGSDCSRLVWSSLKLRPKAEKLRAKLDDKVGALLPDLLQERRWFAAVSVGAGISEELVFRGFLIYYFGAYIPQFNVLEKVLLTSLVFGLAHLYQGRTAIVSTGLMGLALAGLYLMTGSLLLPVLVHAAVDARVLLIFPPPPDEASAALAVGA